MQDATACGQTACQNQNPAEIDRHNTPAAAPRKAEEEGRPSAGRSVSSHPRSVLFFLFFLFFLFLSTPFRLSICLFVLLFFFEKGGSTIYTEGEVDRNFYLINHGEVSLEVQGTVPKKTGGRLWGR